MAISLAKQTAQKIVDTVKDVCGFDINFINPNGIIFASTNETRIGSYHEIGKKVAETKETIEVESDNSFYGTHKGVNIPFVYNRELIAVIGISGKPDEVRQYAVLAQKITALILKEQELDFLNYGRKSQLNYMMRSIVENSNMNHDYFIQILEEYHMTPETICRTILIKLNPRYNLANISLIENQIYKVFDQIGGQLYTFNFPNEYLLFITEENFQKWTYILKAFAKNYESVLVIGIGNTCMLSRQHESYTAARIAIQSLAKGDGNIAFFDSLDLEILFGCITERAKKKYLQKTIGALGKEDIELLQIYYSTDMSLKDTAERLFIHKNTLQYKLNRIEALTGYNPRLFRNAVSLYLAVMIENQMSEES